MTRISNEITVSILEALLEKAKNGEVIIDYLNPSAYRPEGEIINLTLMSKEAFDNKGGEISTEPQWEVGSFSPKGMFIPPNHTLQTFNSLDELSDFINKERKERIEAQSSEDKKANN